MEDAYCELSFSPNVSLVATVRRFVGEFYERVLGDASLASRVVVASHELLDNAVRYSEDGQSTLRVAVKREAEKVRVTIETKNRTADSNRAELIALIEEMNATRADRVGFYQSLLRRSVKRPTGSGLGLGRIHAETEMDVTFRVDAADSQLVHLCAEGLFETTPQKAPSRTREAST